MIAQLINRVTIVIFLTIIISCSDQKQISVSKFPAEFELISTPIQLPELYFQGAVYPFDTLYLITNTINNDYLIYLYNESLQFIGSSAKAGWGAGEVIDPYQAVPDRWNNCVWVLDNARREFLIFPIEAIMNSGNSHFYQSTVRMPDEIDLITNYKIHSAEIISFADVCSEQALITFFDHNGIIIDSLTIWKDPKLSGLENEGRDFGYLTTYLYDTHPENKLHAIAYTFSDIVALIDSKGTVLKIFYGPDKIHQVPDARQNNQVFTYTDICSDEEYIYALYLGKRPVDGFVGINYPQTIHVFSWSGEPIALLKLDQPVGAINIDKKNNRLIALSPFTGELLFLELPESFN